MPAASIRARVRAEMIDEIKAVARQHLAAEGANLSLRAVARDMGMVSSALYRYFASRDDLLTALIMDAYNALGAAVEAADGAIGDRAELRRRWLAATTAVRDWALANPAEYALIYGSPVPGYAAPQDTIPAAARSYAVLGHILADAFASGALPPEGAAVPEAIRADLARAKEGIAAGVPDEVMLAGITAWIQLFGVVSFELFGQFNNVVDARAEFFDAEMNRMADLIGL
ncbi:MAG TPA: TetR-like C-terminal domain-containing protein [Streptosporangiaceae bacterium]|nr:TetR-like C-terminal domain-containing protein [Streptosporangiaceae bacterium]